MGTSVPPVLVEGCTNQDLSTSFVDRWAEITCVCDDFLDTKDIPISKQEGTVLMDGKIQALQNMDGGAATGKKFFNKFMSLMSQLDYLEGSDEDRFQHKKMWKKLCKRVDRRRDRLEKLASKIDRKKASANLQ